MIFRAKLTSCRSFICLVIIGFLFLTVNVFLLWNQQQGTTQNICVCEPSFNVPNSIVDDGMSQKVKKPHPSSKPEEPSKQAVESSTTVEVLPSDNPPHQNETKESVNGHQLAVVVPFRDRYEEMIEFVPHIHKFLDKQKVHHQILIVNQADKHRFNRAALLNIGFLLSRQQCDYMAMHDVDLLPLNDDLKYSYPDRGPLHLSSPELHPLYHYKTFVGGILIMSREQFEQVNGLSNLFWGWGREDDELYVRMKEKGMQVQYPHGITTGTGTFRHIHDREKRKRDQKRYFNQKDVSRRRDRKTGLNTVKYSIVSDLPMTVDGAAFRFVSVDLECDYDLTPFCDTPN